ncbi:hypothetical protein FCM35_KLT18009 [Carex littledalei]|uniref:Uncharacterized protein n=1 Tax=Carex littledalei TaxID=544730 RepID=A0A833VFA2_9POAL|nr:hypothetical protein FCM35_KLT18009 [Carex littledalei]
MEGEERGAAMVSTAPPVVKVGDAKRRWQENPVAPIRLEDVVPPEERAQAPSASVDDTSSTSRTNLWQVYALGMFMVARWIWGRWKERKDRGSTGGSTEDD